MRRYRPSRWRQFAALAILLALVVLRWQFGDELASAPSGGPSAGALRPGMYEIERVVDGDTLLLAPSRMRARLQGVDTPETVKEDTPVEAWGPEAAAFTKAFVDDAGGQLRLEVDGESRDQFDRYLIFAWHGPRLLNEELVRAGLARAKLAYDYGQPKKDRLRAAQREAQRSRRGIWSGQQSR